MDVYGHSIRNRLVRSSNGVLGGVCEGLGKSFNIHPNLVRAGFVLTSFCFGIAIAIYLLLWIVLPNEHELYDYYQDKLLGVCHRISLRTNIELPIVRLITCALALLSLGSIILCYFAFFIYFELRASKSL